MSCNNCPIQNTEYCHLVNPEAKKLTRKEKEEIAEMMKRRTYNGITDDTEMKQRWCKFGYKTEREIQKYKDVLLMRMHGWRVSLLFCNNCDFAMIAHKVYDCENLHWVCPVCFMPSENKNPLKKDLDNV